MAFQNIVKKVATAAAFILMAGGITCFPVSASQSGYQKISAECGKKEFTVTGVLPKGTTLSVKRCNDSAYKDAVVDLEGKEHVCDADVYDISLKDANGKEFEPERDVNVTFTDAEEDLGNGESVSVYHFEDDDADRAEKLKVKRVGEDAAIKTDSFSKFAVVRRAAANTVTLDIGANINSALKALKGGHRDATAIVFTRTAPASGVTTKNISSGGKVVAYLDGSTINIYVPAPYKASLNANSANMFKWMYNATQIQFNNLIDTSTVTDMSGMFSGCSSLTSLDVTRFETSNVTTMSAMFSSCSSLTSLDVANFDTSNVTNMAYMFGGCAKLSTLDVSNFNTAIVTNMYNMFEDCSSLTSLDVTNFDTSNVTEMYGMFDGCTKLSTLDVSKFDTANVTDMLYMFEDCSSLTSLDVTNFNTSNVTNMSSMFRDCSSLTSLNLTSFNTSKVKTMAYMLQGDNLRKIELGSSFVVPANATNVFPSPTTTSSGRASNGKWGLNSEHAAVAYSAADLATKGQTKGALAGTWYAQAISYTVHFNANGGTGTMADETFPYDTAKALTANTFTRTGYRFIGWNTDANGNGTPYADQSSVKNLTNSATITLYAQWTVNQYTVTCEDWFVDASNNRKVKLGSSTKQMAYGTTASGTAWGTDGTDEKYYVCYTYKSATSATVGTSGATVYRYFWAWTDLNVYYAGGTTQNGATVSFKVGNGTWSDVTNEINTVQPYGTTYYLKNIRPIHEYEEFSRVENLTYDSTNGYYTYTPTYGGTSMVVYLKYKTYSLTYNLNGGSVSGNPTSYNYSTVSFTLKNPTRTGYTFTGWTGSNGTTAQTSVTVAKGSYGNKSYTANWSANKYTVSFNANGGSGTTASVSATYNSNMPAITNGISRTGYTFTGYYDAASGGTKYYNADGSSARTWNKTANATLYAQWTLTPHKFDVNPMAHVTGFRLKKNDADADGGKSIGDYYADAYMGDKFYLYSPTFATGYEFSSFTNQYGPGSQTTSGSTATVTMGAGAQAIAIYAKATTYSISYNANGGTLSGQPTSYTIESAAITLPTPTRTGYTFTGWTGSNGTTPQTTVTIPNGSYGNKSYTANWKANTNTKYTVIHQQEQLDGTYKTVETQNLTGTTDTKVTPAVKSYTGFTSPATQTVNIAGAGNTVVTYKYARNTYTITRQYRLENADGTFTGYSRIDSKKYKYGASIAAWNRAADTTYKAASIAAYTVTTKNDTLSVNVMRNTSTNNAIQYRLQNTDGSYPSTYTAAWSGTLRYGESHTWNYAQTASHQATSKAVSYNGGTVNVNVPRRTGRLVIHANGGTGDRNTTAILYGASDKINPMPSRTGYTLTGLYTAASGGTKVVNADGTMTNDGTYSASGAWKLNSDVNVYAQWTVNQYPVTCEDWFVDKDNNRKVKLGSSIKQMDYGTTASGTAWGTDGTDGKYYVRYTYKSATSATVGTSGATVYRYFWAWTDLNIYYADGNTQCGAVVSFKIGNGSWQDVNNEWQSITVQPYGTTYYLKNIRPYHEYEEFSHTNMTYDRTNGYYTYTSTVANEAMKVFLKYKTYSLTYNLNGGTVKGNPTSYNYGTVDFTLKNPTKAGYTFTGWTGPNGTTAQTTVTVKKGSYGNKTYTANWRANSYTVKFDMNSAYGGGSGTMADEVFTYDTAKALTKNTFSSITSYDAPLYQFTGWNTKADGTGTAYSDQASVKNLATSGTITLYAQWNRCIVDVNVDVDGGTNALGGDPVCTDLTPVVFDVYVNGTQTEHDIVDYYQFIDRNATYKFVVRPFLTGYTITGLSGVDTVSNSGSTWTGTGTVKHAMRDANCIGIELTRVKYTISYNMDGGTNNSDNPTSYNIVTSDIKLKDPTKTGYTFLYWTLDGDATNKQYTSANVAIAQKSTGNKSFTAHWKAHNTNVTLDMQGGTQKQLADCAVSADGSTEKFPTTYDSTSYSIRNAPSRTGYTFQGYYTKPNGQGVKVYGVDARAAADGTYWTSSNTWHYTGPSVTFYAYWSANPYTVHFDANTGTGTMKDQTLTYNQNGTLSANAFTKKGYSFTGWTANADGTGKKFADKDAVSNLVTSGSITLYAQWQKNPYTVTVPKKVQYQNMNAGTVDHTVSIPITVSGDFPGAVSVTSKPDTLTAPDGKTLNMETNSHKSAITFTAGDGTKNDALTITGTARLDKYSGIVQYSVSQTE